MILSVGLGLLHRFLTDEMPIGFFAENDITEQSFAGNEADAFQLIVNHFQNFGVLPKIETIEAELKIKFPEFPNEPISYWAEKVERRRQSMMMTKAAQTILTDAAEGEVEDARSALKTLFFDLEARAPSGRVFDLANISDDVVAKHDKVRMLSEEVSGIPFGIKYLDEITGGAQPGDTVALVGRPSLGKTYFTLQMALSAWERNRTPLIVSLEMPADRCARRVLALRSHVPVTMVRLGKLGFWGRGKLVADIGQLKEFRRSFHIMEGTLDSTVEDIALKVRELRPDCLYIDGAYMLRTRREARSRQERIAETAEFIKRMASEFEIPILSTYQFNRKGPGFDNIYMSDVIGQLASIVLGIDDEEEAEDFPVHGAAQFKSLELFKGREGERGKMRIVFDMQRMVIEQDSVLEGYENGGM